MHTALGPLVEQVSVKRVKGEDSNRMLDVVAVEEPLAIRLQYWFKGVQRTENLALTMRTPGHDQELAAGFLYAEGVIRSSREIVQIRRLGGETSNELLVEVSSEVDVEMWRMSRSAFVSSSCGVCGKRTLAAIQQDDVLDDDLPASHPDRFSFGAASIHRLPALLTAHQDGFAQTGGLHAAAVIDDEGEVNAVFEDIGRHNALDKLIGSQLLTSRLPLARKILFLSSRGSFELVQKAITAGAPVLATVGSPSSLAIESARRYGLTLIGFVRNDRFNIYSGEWRLHS